MKENCDRCKALADHRMPVKIGEPHGSIKLLICSKCWNEWATLLDKQESERTDLILERNEYKKEITA